MPQGGYGSLTGKARRVQRMARFARWEAEQAVGEYDHEDLGAETDERPIPVGHRAEFFPTVEASLDDSAVGPAFEQLELEFSRGDESGRAGDAAATDREYAAWAEAAANASGTRLATATPARVAEPEPRPTTAAKPIKFTPADSQPVGLQPAPVPVIVRPRAGQPANLMDQQPAPTAPRFTLRGFFLGCALGSAAAVLMILVVHVLVG